MLYAEKVTGMVALMADKAMAKVALMADEAMGRGSRPCQKSHKVTNKKIKLQK